MKKFLALLLSAILLLSACAFAEEADISHSYALQDVVLTLGETSIDFSNIKLCLDVSNDGPAALAHMDVDGETAAEIGFTKAENFYVMHMAGSLMGHKDFIVDPVVQMEKSLQGGIDGLIAMLQGVDTHALAEKIVNFIESPKAAPDEALEAEPEVEEPEEAPTSGEEGTTITIDLSDISVKGDVMGTLKGCVTNVKDAEMDGSDDIPAGKYDMEWLYIDDETIANILDMVYVKDEPAGLGDMLRESGAAIGLSAAVYTAEGVTATDITLAFEMQGEGQSLHTVIVKTEGESGSTTNFSLTIDSNGTPAGLKFTAVESAELESSFTPDSVDLEEAVNLDELSEEEALAALSEAFKALQVDVMIPIAAPIMEIMMANVDMDELQAAIDEASADTPAA